MPAALRWYKGQKLLDAPVDGKAVRIVGEDEWREQGIVSASGDNLLWAGRREKVDIEILEVTLQNQSTLSNVSAQLHLSGYLISGSWQLAVGQFWSHPGFILMAGQQIFLRLSAAASYSFEIRWRLYYGRKK